MKNLDKYIYIRTPKDEIMMREMYTISVDNSNAVSYNINIDRPTFTCFAFSEAEAIGKMILSDFQYKYNKILTINN